MFGIGMPEMLLILAVALIVIGPKKLPDLAKSLGRAMGEFKRATTDIKDSIESETQIGEVKNAFKDLNQDIKNTLEPAKLERKPSAEQPKPAPSATEPPPEASSASSTQSGTPEPTTTESSSGTEDSDGPSPKDAPRHV